jgi:cytochrome P450
LFGPLRFARAKGARMVEPTISTLGGLDIQGVLLEVATESPTAIESGTGIIWVLRYEEVNQIILDQRTVGVGLEMFDMMGIDDGPLREWYGSLMFTTEGQTHVRLRRLVNRAFTLRSTAALRESTGVLVAEIYAQLVADGGGDLIPAFRQVPMKVMCRLLGVPEDDSAIFGDWVDALSPTFGFMEPEQINEASEAIGHLLGYMRELADERRGSPGDDLITHLLNAEEDGDRLTHEELVAMVANLLVGGHDTTSSQIGCTLLTLLQNPDGLDVIRENPELAGTVVSETMRLEPSIPGIPRMVAEPMQVGGIERGAGTVLLLSLTAANRDPAVWGDPESFVPTRFAEPEVPKLLSFGMGPHVCLGSHLARMTLEQVALGLAECDLRLSGSPDEVEWKVVLGRSPSSLKVTVD